MAIKKCKFCGREFEGRSLYCKKGCRTLHSQRNRFTTIKVVTITEAELDAGSLGEDGKPKLKAIKNFLRQRGVLVG